MATLKSYLFFQLAQVALAPVAADPGSQALAGAPIFAGFAPGDSLVVASTAAFHLIASAGAGVAATVAAPRFAAGVYKFSLPDGCNAVSMIDTAGGAAGFGQAYKG